MKNISIIIFVFLFFNLINAQPGWEDLTKRYDYTILDKNKKEISFKENKNYSVMIDKVLYKAPNIPQESLKENVCCDNEFGSHIRINDFSLEIPKKTIE